MMPLIDYKLALLAVIYNFDQVIDFSKNLMSKIQHVITR